MKTIYSFTAIIVILIAPQFSLSQSRSGTVAIPFVGCGSDGQAGPVATPKGNRIRTNLSTNVAQRLAYYSASHSGGGVLAPRGWYCFSTYGSSGETLYVSPTPIIVDTIISDKWKGFAGPAIELCEASGGTSGRFAVAELIARIFPDYRAFVREVIEEHVEPASGFPSGPYSNDSLVCRNNRVVEFRTPANVTGLGSTAAPDRSTKTPNRLRAWPFSTGKIWTLFSCR